MITLILISCATTTVATKDQDTSSSTQPSTETADTSSIKGAWITSDCVYEDYSYAIDILLSCGDEVFGEELRLHTFKRHAHTHGKVFNDQLLTHRDDQLWFDAYETPRCVTTSNNRMFLSTSASQCTAFDLIDNQDGFFIQERDSEKCVTLGNAICDSHQWTGGRECGGIDHRYLPIVMDSCDNALSFRVATAADSCNGEYPEAECF